LTSFDFQRLEEKRQACILDRFIVMVRKQINL